MSQNFFGFAVAKVQLFLLLTMFFGQNFSNILYLIDNQNGIFCVYWGFPAGMEYVLKLICGGLKCFRSVNIIIRREAT